MKTLKTLAAAAAVALVAVSAGDARAASENRLNARDIAFSFEGPFGTFDRAQLQRGYLVYRDVCASCHAMSLMRFRNLSQEGGPEFSEDEVKALAAAFQVQAGPDDQGEMFERPGIPSDPFPSPFPNEPAARAANNGAYPPDLSLITKAREGWSFPWYVSPFLKLFKGNGGPEYVHAVLVGYGEPPAELAAHAPEGSSYNPYFEAGPWIAMAEPLSEGAVEFADGTPATVDQMSRDVSAFLAWASEPHMEQRKRIGFKVMAYLALLSLLLYLTKKKIWAREAH